TAPRPPGISTRVMACRSAAASTSPTSMRRAWERQPSSWRSSWRRNASTTSDGRRPHELFTRHEQGVEPMTDRLRNAVALGFACALIAGAANAGTEDRLGTGGNSAARIMVGARSVGLAYSDLASTQGVEAMFGNPAGLAAGEANTEVLFSHAEYIADMNL